MNVFWEQRVVPNIVKGKSMPEAETLLAAGAVAVEVRLEWKCRYYPFERPTRPSLVPFEYVDDRYMVWLNPDGVDFIRDFSFSAPVVGDLCFHLQDTVYMASLGEGFPVGLCKGRIHLSAASTMLKEGHPVLPVFCLTGVVLSNSLRAEMHRVPAPPVREFAFVVQQCNCLTLKPHGKSEGIVRAHPETGPYKNRVSGGQRTAKEECRGIPGTLHVAGNVVCFLAQWRPGKPDSSYFRRYPESEPPETTEQREKWFQECLDRLGEMCQEPVAIAFPDRIGCQMAGGNWNRYEKMISRFAASLPEGSRVHITNSLV